MPFQKLTFRPGLNTTKTPLLNEGGISGTNLIRFREGIPEVYGGWQALLDATLTGIARGMHAWATLAGIPTLAIGTNLRLYVIQGVVITTPFNPFTTAMGFEDITVNDPAQPSGLMSGNVVSISGASPVGGVTPQGPYTVILNRPPLGNYLITLDTPPTSSVAAGGGSPTIQYIFNTPTAYDITPLYDFSIGANPFTTAIHSAVVQVADPYAPATILVGSIVEFSGGTAVGGLTISGAYGIAGIFPTYYTIIASSEASSTATGGGTPVIGYGIAGQGSSGSNLAPNGPPQALTWTLDNFGEDLIACARGFPICAWSPTGGVTTRAAMLSTDTTPGNFVANAIFVSNGAEQVVALGSAPADIQNSAFDPMLVSWCNSGDYTTWIASATNDAGNFQLTDGSQLLWGGRAAQQNLIWSDTALYSMQFIGGELIYSFIQLGTACGLIGPQAAGIVNGVAYWMSNLNFMFYNGTVGVIDCPVRDLVFKNLDTAQAAKIICAVNSQFNEVRWDFPSVTGDTAENDSFVVFNFAENTWTFSSNAQSGAIIVARTAWADVSVFGTPTAVDINGNVWSHEVQNVYSAGVAAMPWFLKSGYIDIAAGEQIMFVDMVVPDQFIGNGEAVLTMSAQMYSSDTPVAQSGAITGDTEFLILPLRGRQIAFEFENLGSTSFWRLGAVRVRAAPDGRN